MPLQTTEDFAWREEALRLAAGTLGAVLLGGFGIAALVGQLRRVESSERALRQSEERYALALEGANEGHWDWDVVPDRLYLSPTMVTDWLIRNRDRSIDRDGGWYRDVSIRHECHDEVRGR